MNRVIKFRGKRTDKNEWVYGAYHSCTSDGKIRMTEWSGQNPRLIDKPVTFNNHWILTPHTPQDEGWDIRDTYEAYEVNADTVVQFTDRLDRHGIEIWEGDVVRPSIDHITCDCLIVWEAGAFKLETVVHKQRHFLADHVWAKLENIGSIHDNPSLLTPNKQEGHE